jgi:UDP-N-acetylenolpyruvoylglucosamine reductase
MITAKERDYLSQALDKIPFEVDCLLKKFSRYKTGGVGKIVVYPNTELELVTALENLKGKYPIFVIGGGSNLLISDNGFDGVIISTQNLDKITLKSNLITCECGAKISDVIKESTLNSLSGLEFLVGVPATVGGAVAMNAGCFNKSIADVVCYVVNIESANFVFHLSVKNNLHKQIAEFLAHKHLVILIECLNNLVGFFNKILLYACVRLLRIPRATAGSS